jgi:hypothetical protein
MYLFARSRAVNPARGRQAVAVAIEAGSRGTEMLGFPVYVWTTVLSQSLTVMWSARVEHLGELIAADDTLAASDEFMDWLDGNDGVFAGPFQTTVSNVVHGAPTGPPAAFIQVVQATCANGSVSEGMAMGVELAETAGRITGHTTMFLSLVAGQFGGVGWLTGYGDLAALEAANDKLMASNEWLKLVDRAGHMYQPGAETALLRRIG